MKASELLNLLNTVSEGEDLEIKVEMHPSMGDHEPHGSIIVDRVKTPDYIRIKKVFVARPIHTEQRHKRRA